jgi:hypothetical protein
MIGLDTGFFVEFLRANPHTVSVWESLTENDEEAVVSCLTLFELERLGLKKAIGDTHSPRGNSRSLYCPVDSGAVHPFTGGCP